MNINGIGHGHNVAPPRLTRTGHTPHRDGNEGPSASSGDVAISSQNAGGVLRLLQEGHFRGVADARLRINFADQLGAIDQQAQGDSILGGMGNLLAAVSDEIASFLETAQPGESISIQITIVQQTFISSTQQAAQNFIDDPSPGIQSLFDRIQALFDELEEGLISILSAIDTDGEGGSSAVTTSVSLELSVSIETVSVSTEGSGLSDEFQAFIDALREAFDDAFAQFSDAVTSSGVLPDLSDPNGNGVAFDKFVAILEDLVNDTQSASGDGNVIFEA